MDFEGLDELANLTSCEHISNLFMTIVMIIIVVVGLFGNLIVFFVILVLKEYKKSVSNWYVLQLALADTLFLLMLPFTAADEMQGKWDFSEGLCKAKEGILMVNYYASIFFLTIMSFDRYMAVTKSGVSRWADILRRLDSAAIISLIAWLVSIALAVPIYLYSDVTKCDQCAYNFPLSDQEKCFQANKNETECDKWLKSEMNVTGDGVWGDYSGFNFLTENETDKVIWEWKNITQSTSESLTETCVEQIAPQSYRLWLYLNFFVLLVLPFVLICIFYGLILLAMMGTATTASTNQRKYRRRVTLMVLGLVTLFAVSWVPWYGIMMARITGFELAKGGCKRLVNFARIMSYLNSALNPYFYSFMGSRFHQRFLRARTTATRRSRIFSFLSRVSWTGHDSNGSTSGGGTFRNNNCKDTRLSRVKSQSDDEDYTTKTNIRTERTMVDVAQQ